MKAFAPALLGLFLLGGCVSSGASGAITPLPQNLSTGARIVSVNLHNTPQGVPAGFADRFAANVMEEMQVCADGDQPLSLDVRLDGYHAPNPGMALLAPMKSEISGVARLLDSSGALVGEYRIQRSIMVGGLAGAVVASNAENNMSEAFGDELCKQAFGA